MRIDFRQGIIKYPSSYSIQKFLSYSSEYISLTCVNGPTDVAFAHYAENYLLSESADVPNAWGPIPLNTNCWLYWDIDLRTAVRTFGFTTIQPITSVQQPPAVEGQHWFNVGNTTMSVCENGHYHVVARVFAAMVNNGAFTPLGNTLGANPYAGTQVGLNTFGTRIGQIVIDDSGNPIRRVDGRLFTTENEFFVDGSPVNVVKLDAAVVPVTAVTMLPKYHVVKFTDFGWINIATYEDVGNSTIAMLTEDLTTHDTGYVVIQGCITNPDWDWPTLATLWVDDLGDLTYVDPHLLNPLAHPDPRPPVARVVSRDTIIFDQGLGGLGPRGPAGKSGDLASANTVGISRLSVEAADAADPVVVGDNDPRMTNARTPVAHTQSATTVIPTPYGTLTGANLQLVLQQIEDGKVKKVGDTMTGPLLLSGAPTQSSQAATKAYVDAVDLSSRVAKSGDSMSGYLTLVGNPVNTNHAATKAYVDAIAQGIAIKPNAKVATTVNLAGTYDNGNAGVGGTLTLPASATLNIDGITDWTLTDGVLVKDQASAVENGRYYVSQIGNAVTPWILTRCGYCDEASEIPSSYVFVQHGDTQSGTGWIALVYPATGGDVNTFEVGLDNITFSQFSGEGTYIAGYGISVTGKVISVSTLNIPYDISLYVGGFMEDDGTVVSGAAIPRDVYISGSAPHIATAMVAPTNSVEYEIYVRTSGVETLAGTITFNAMSIEGVVNMSNTSVPAGSVVLVRINTAVPDPTIQNLFIVLVGCAAIDACSLS